MVFWCLPTYAAVASILLLAPLQAAIPFRLQLALTDTWMLVAVFLPITTVVAGFKASGVHFRADDKQTSGLVITCGMVPGRVWGNPQRVLLHDHR